MSKKYQNYRSVKDELKIEAGKTAFNVAGKVVGGVAFATVMTAIGLPHVGLAGGAAIASSGSGNGNSDSNDGNFDLSDWTS